MAILIANSNNNLYNRHGEESGEWMVGRMCLSEQDVEKIVLQLRDTIMPYLIILFGSCVKGIMRSDSDIDIAFLSDRRFSAYEVFAAAQQLALLLGREVDLVDLGRASTVMKAQIVSSGQVIYCSDEVRRMNFFMNTLKEYAVLNEQRAPVLAAIQQNKVGDGR